MDDIKIKVFKGSLKRMLVLWQLYKYTLEDIRTSDYVKELAANAKKNNTKNFLDLRVVAADQINVMNAAMFKMKRTMQSSTWNELISDLSSDQVHEINILLEEVVSKEVEDIQQTIKYLQDSGKKQDNQTENKDLSNKT